MNFNQLFKSAISSLRSNIMRTGLTMLGIIIGIASVILIISIAQGATESITSQISSFGTNLLFISPGGGNANGSPQSTATNTLTYSDAKEIAKLADVSAVSATVGKQFRVVAGGINTNVTVSGVSADYMTIESVAVSEGDFISSDDENGLARVAVVGPQVVTDLFGDGFNPVGQIINIDSKPFRIIGVTQAKGSGGFSNPDDTIYIPITTEMQIMLGQTYVSSILLDARDPNTIDQTTENIKQLLLDRHKITDPTLADFRISSSQQALTTLNTITGLLTTMLAGIAAISLLVGGIGIMNIMLVTVTERTKEIGLLKAIGAKRKDILTQFLIESIVLTISGGVIGIVIGTSLAYLITTFLLHVPFVIQIFSIVLAVGVSTLVGVAFGLYPAQKAAKLSPIEALRFE